MLTGHRGLAEAVLFTDLDKLQEGDKFYLHIMDEVLAYQVDQVKVVLPEETDDLTIVQGQDYCTLVTCTPYAINTHRMLVRGIRVPYNGEEETGDTPQVVQYQALHTGTDVYKRQEKPITPGTHTLTMYYMERGMWESNMAIAFNFPDHNELQVEKEVDLTDVNDIFKSSFQNRELLAFTIQNQATHYGAKEADDSTGKVQTKTVDLESAKLTTTTTDTSSGNIFALADDPDTTNKGQALHWYAPYTDTSSSHRRDRYGILTLEKPIDISSMKYLTCLLYTSRCV